MKIQKLLKELRKCCHEHWEDVASSGKVELIRYSIESYEIWGGNGDRDTDCRIMLTKDGWILETTTTETGLYQKGTGVVSKTTSQIDEEGIEKLLNGEKLGLYEIKQVVNAVDDLRGKYPREFSVL